MTTCLGISDITGGKSNILYHVLKVVDDRIGPIILHMSHGEINQNA